MPHADPCGLSPSPPALTSRAGDRYSCTSRSPWLSLRLPGSLLCGRGLYGPCQPSSRTRTAAVPGHGPWALLQAWSIHMQPAGRGRGQSYEASALARTRGLAVTPHGKPVGFLLPGSDGLSASQSQPARGLGGTPSSKVRSGGAGPRLPSRRSCLGCRPEGATWTQVTFAPSAAAGNKPLAQALCVCLHTWGPGTRLPSTPPLHPLSPLTWRHCLFPPWVKHPGMEAACVSRWHLQEGVGVASWPGRCAQGTWDRQGGGHRAEVGRCGGAWGCQCRHQPSGPLDHPDGAPGRVDEEDSRVVTDHPLCKRGPRSASLDSHGLAA